MKYGLYTLGIPVTGCRIMGTAEHVDFFKKTLQHEQGVGAWNRWRKNNPYIDPQLYGCALPIGADLRKVDLSRAYLYDANFRGADLREANLDGAHLRIADLRDTDLRNAWMLGTALHETKLHGAKLDRARVHGVSVWRIETDENTSQHGLIITLDNETILSVDDLEIAQFIYLILNNKKIQAFFNAMTSRAVLILGRFGDRKTNLEAIHKALRDRNYLPILFDFDVPEDRDITETVRTLAGLARYIIADLTDPASIPKELEAIVPKLAVPVQPLLQGSTRAYTMFSDYWKYDWVLKVHRYEEIGDLLASFDENVIAPAETMAALLDVKRKAVKEDSGG